MTTRTTPRRILFLFAFLACTRAQAGSQWIFNEILADPGRANDSNNNGNFDSIEDEFLELVNLSGEDVDISGWTISDLVPVRHIFTEGSLVD
ncbi:MAG: lamin tail domain-containing protein, partial [Planctomycetes bacterium]|nr:lamin tail domain-containing protein [Planctomycetota bacterium]